MNKKRKCDKNTPQYSKPPHTNLQGNWSAGFSVYRGWMDTHTDRRTNYIYIDFHFAHRVMDNLSITAAIKSNSFDSYFLCSSK